MLKVSVALIFASLDDVQQLKVYNCLKEYSGNISIKTAKEIKKAAIDEHVEKIEISELEKVQDKREQNIKNSGSKEESKGYDDIVITQSLEFTQQLLPNWFKEHHIQVKEDPNTYKMDLLEKVYHQFPELLSEKLI